MIEKLKKVFDSENLKDVGDVDNLDENLEPEVQSLIRAKKRADEARVFIQEITPQLKKLEERNEKLDLLLPFEKLEVLKKQIQILEAGHKILYSHFSYADYSQDNTEKNIIAEKIKKISAKTNEKKKEFYEIRVEAMKIKQIYRFPYSLIRDPRVKNYKEYQSNPFRQDENILVEPAFRHFPIDKEEQEKVLNSKGFRYPKEQILEIHEAVEKLRNDLIESDIFINDTDNLFKEIGL